MNMRSVRQIKAYTVLVVLGKYLNHTPSGRFSLKSFFSSSGIVWYNCSHHMRMS